MMMRRRSQFAALLLPAALAAGGLTAANGSAGGSHLGPTGVWHPRGNGPTAMASWRGREGEPYVSIRCDRNDPRLLLRVASPHLPVDIDTVTLVADGVGMDYPVERSTGAVTARIALDAPILDRMVVARAFGIVAGGRQMSTGVPGEALARVVRACRALYWPREARIEASDAGLAKK